MNTSASQAVYNDSVVRQFSIMTVVWGVVGMLVGVLIIYLPVTLSQGALIALAAIAAMFVAFHLTKPKAGIAAPAS